MQIDRAERDRRNALSNDAAMADAQSLCLPCKLCGGKAKISDAGSGWGYYITCENAASTKPACIVGEPRRSGWAYNVMDLWNSLHATPVSSPARDEEIERLKGEIEAARIGDAVLSWLVKFDLADAGNEYRAEDVVNILNELAPVSQPQSDRSVSGDAVRVKAFDEWFETEMIEGRIPETNSSDNWLREHLRRAWRAGSTANRYYLSKDNDVHWYIIPYTKLAEWEEWLSLDVDDEASWNAPDFATRVGGSPSMVTFENPKVEW